jgi:hypothetical protein
MRRSWASLLCIAAGLAAGGCADHGTYSVSWHFAGDDPSLLPACGQHGVDSIRVTGASTGGDHENFAALCTPGTLAHSVPVGTWTFEVRQVDVRGNPIMPYLMDAQGQVVLDPNANPLPAPDPTATGDIAKDQTVSLVPDPVELIPLPACSDGVDNDGDHRVDMDDPDCMLNPYGASECPAAGC